MAKKAGIRKTLEKLEKEEKDLEKLAKLEKKELDKVLARERNIEKEEQDIERVLFSFLGIRIKKYHIQQITKGFIGAFFGIVVSNFLFDFQMIIDVPWVNIVGITTFLIIVSVVVLYNQEKRFIRKVGNFHMVRELIILYVSAFIGIFFTLFFFNLLPLTTGELFARYIFIFLVPAITGALTLTVI